MSGKLAGPQRRALEQLASHGTWFWNCGWSGDTSPSDLAHVLLSMVEARLVEILERDGDDPRDWTFAITDRGRRQVGDATSCEGPTSTA